MIEGSFDVARSGTGLNPRGDWRGASDRGSRALPRGIYRVLYANSVAALCR